MKLPNALGRARYLAKKQMKYRMTASGRVHSLVTGSFGESKYQGISLHRPTSIARPRNVMHAELANCGF
jgi:hypothetical protein